MSKKPLPPLDLTAPDLRFGPYRIVTQIGEGGMGLVYEGEHVNTRERVALKIASKRRHDGSIHRASIRREIDALYRVQHPGIVRILDHGEAHGVPWVAMDLVQGRTLKDHLQTLWHKPDSSSSVALAATLTATPASEPAGGRAVLTPRTAAPPLGPLLTLIRRLCEPLAFLHGEGLVHRDLKPENILLQEDGRPVIIDLGIAMHFGAHGREELDVDRVAGSVPYMAPELLCGDLIDARADLYALGCILYECVTGRTPFSGNTMALMRQHVSVRPAPPSHHIPGLPPDLDALILKLLMKDPRARIGHAAHVASTLVSLGAEAEPPQGPTPRAYLYRPALVGRAETMARLQKMVERAADRRRGGLVLLCGESGVGKTRLAKEIAYKAAHLRAEKKGQPTVLSGRCVAPGAGERGSTVAVAAPLHPLRPVLVAAADLARGSRAEAERLFGSHGKVLALYAPELLDLPGQAEQPAPALPPANARARVITAMRETLWALAETCPLVIMLDDLQWADDLTLSVLASLPKDGLAERGVLIVATYRVDEARRELEAISASPGALSISLERLDQPHVDAMISDMLGGSSLPLAEVDALFRASRGNPFFVAQYLHAAIDEGILRRGADGRLVFDLRAGAGALSTIALPRTLAELIERRIDHLDAEGQRLVAWAAVLGQEIKDDLLLSGLEDEDAAIRSLAALKERQVLEEAEGGGWRFVHDKVRELAYQRISSAARIALHRRVGEALEPQHAANPDRAAALGRHFAEAGLHEKAGRYFARAARHAQQVYANNDAVRLYRAAISALLRAPVAAVERAELADLQESLGDVLALIGSQDEAEDAYRSALEATSPSANVTLARLHRKRGKTSEMRHQHTEALERYGAAESSLGPAPLEGSSAPNQAWWHEWLQIHLDRISVHYWKAEISLLHALVEKIQLAVDEQATPLQRGHYFHALTQLHLQLERFARSKVTARYARESISAYQAAGEAREGHWVLSGRFTLAFVVMLDGSLSRAQKDMLAVFPAAKRIGDLEVQIRCLTYLTVTYRRRRLTDEAEDMAQKSHALATREQVNEYIGAALGNLSWVALSRGRDADAARLGRAALACWEQLELVYPFQWLARLPLCAVALKQGRLEDAIEQARAVLDIRQQRLPEPLTDKLEAAIKLFQQNLGADAKADLVRALTWAMKRGYT